MDNPHVLGVFFYGSYLTGFYNKKSDIDLHIIMDDSDPKTIIRGMKYIDGYKIEYFEKPISDIYKSIITDFNNQNNALLSIIGTSEILFSKSSEINKLQESVKDKFKTKLPPLKKERSMVFLSEIELLINYLKNIEEHDSKYYKYFYSLIIEKIRKLYHRLNSFPQIPTSKVLRLYNDEEYRKSFGKQDIPEEIFRNMYIEAIKNKSNLLDMKSDLMLIHQHLMKDIDYAVNPSVNYDLPAFTDDDDKEMVAIINNRMEKLEKAYYDNVINKEHLSYLTAEKIRKFYHRLHGVPVIMTDDLFEHYRNKTIMLDSHFTDLFLDTINSDNKKEIGYSDILHLYDYSKRDVQLNKEFRIRIKSRNNDNVIRF